MRIRNTKFREWWLGGGGGGEGLKGTHRDFSVSGTYQCFNCRNTVVL